jgi:hypothetical protein
MSRMVPLRDIAQISLGYKSLQNDFFYLNQATVDRLPTAYSALSRPKRVNVSTEH